jgi:dienelactone hydrolase
MSLKGMGQKIKCPVMTATGEGDQLSPVQYAIEFHKSLAGPKRLVIYEGEPHPIADPNLQHNLGDFLVDAFKGKKIESGITIVEPGGARRALKDA